MFDVFFGESRFVGFAGENGWKNGQKENGSGLFHRLEVWSGKEKALKIECLDQDKGKAKKEKLPDFIAEWRKVGFGGRKEFEPLATDLQFHFKEDTSPYKFKYGHHYW